MTDARDDQAPADDPQAPLLEQLLQGQLGLHAELAAGRRRLGWLTVLLVLALGGLAFLYVDHMQRPPVLVEGRTVEADLDALVAEVAALQQKLEASREERNKHLGETLQLRQRLLEAERRVADLTGGLDDLARAADRDGPPPPERVRTDERPLEDHPARPVNQALAASGLGQVSVVELEAVRDGRLLGVLLADLDDQGLPAEVARYDRAWLQARTGVVSLVLERDPPEEGAEPEAPRRLAMPAVDLAAWRTAGLALDDVTTVADVLEALEVLLAPLPYSVEGLGGWDGDALHDLELVERDETGAELARYRAARAELLPVGPTLLLSEGSKLVGGSERPFWQGRLRLVLSGASYGSFLEALRGAEDERG